jgi:alanyl-tRNA synthetase
MQQTLKLFDRDSHLTTCEATVLSCEFDQEKNAYAIILDQTVFFPEGGGQFADTGFIDKAEVFDAQIHDEIITHYTKSALPVGSTVTCQIDWCRRFDFMQQHSAEHIVSGLVHNTYGYNNVGFHLGMTETTLDFDGPLTPEQIHDLEIKANQAVYENVAFDITFPDAETLKALNYRSKKELSGEVRIVTLPGYDVCACCAPHVYHTGQIGTIKIVNYMVHRGGMRLTILCGARALSDYQKKQTSVEQISALLSVKQPLVAAGVAKAKEDQQALILRINDLQKKVLEAELKSLPSPETTSNVFLFQKDLDTKAIRNAVNDLCTRYHGYCGIFLGDDQTGYTFVIGSSSKDCREAATALRNAFGAKGGGSAKMIQGSTTGTETAIRNIFL